MPNARPPDDHVHRNCLDKGWVRLVDKCGSDLEIVRDARASFMKDSAWVFGEKVGLVPGECPQTNDCRPITSEQRFEWRRTARRMVDQLPADVVRDWLHALVVFDAEVEDGLPTVSLSEKDRGLLRFLAAAQPTPHMSPFRSSVLKFEIKAPMIVARQWFKYRVGCAHSPDTAELIGAPQEALDFLGMCGDKEGFGDSLFSHNEASRRYVTMEPEFYVPAPDQWRAAPQSRKQGSGAALHPLNGGQLTGLLHARVEQAQNAYQAALEIGACAEQSRFFLPMYCMYTVWRWTASIEAVCFMLRQRRAEATDAQKEWTPYADGIAALVEPHFPEAFPLLMAR